MIDLNEFKKGRVILDNNKNYEQTYTNKKGYCDLNTFFKIKFHMINGSLFKGLRLKCLDNKESFADGNLYHLIIGNIFDHYKKVRIIEFVYGGYYQYILPFRGAIGRPSKSILVPMGYDRDFDNIKKPKIKQAPFILFDLKELEDNETKDLQKEITYYESLLEDKTKKLIKEYIINSF